MTTLIVGCGYLGRRMAARLIARGERVFGSTRDARKAAELERMGVEPIVLDVLGAAIEIPPFDRLVYCLGFDRSSGRSRREVYVEGLRRFLRTRETPIPRFVYTSSTSVYGQDGGASVTEDDSTDPRTESGQIVLEAEWVARVHGAIVLRLAGLYGPGRIIRRASIVAREAIAGDPEKRINLVHVDDAALAVVAALDRGTPGRIYNVADDRPAMRGELYGRTAHLLGAPPPQFVPSAGEEADRIIANHRMKEELEVALRYPDVSTGLHASIEAERITPPPLR
jgi:nucleoside-diphosphate-sugar epimerase